MNGSAAEVVVESCPLQPHDTLVQLIDRFGLEREGPLASTWARAARDPLPIISHLLVARLEEDHCGLAVAFRRPAGKSGRMIAVEVDEAQR